VAECSFEFGEEWSTLKAEQRKYEDYHSDLG